MDDYMFRSYVTNFTVVEEATSYLEILNYSVFYPGFVSHPPRCCRMKKRTKFQCIHD